MRTTLLVLFTLTACGRAPVELTFGFARAGQPLELAGSVSAGTDFIRGASTPDGGFEVSPYPRGATPQAAQDRPTRDRRNDAGSTSPCP